ncbi:uncharacterized protein LOC131604203 [Vicia villosa]|uniref:uncharacterized protein LOC131604203 n=1 Tax=Vicia villosa TaxID=3911 RepID=UPI00273BFEAD|nr:uncharacterized protein LOC131604203 [Vicia villosa]
MGTPANNITIDNNDKDHYSYKPPMFDGENFDYWKDKIETYFMAFDFDLWDLVADGYNCPVDSNGVKIIRSAMTDYQKKAYKNHFKAMSILLSPLSYDLYEKITNKETAKSIFDSLKMNHEGNSQVKETMALTLIQKYEAFKMEEEEFVETMFSRFQILVAGLKVLEKGYSNSDHVKKIIRSLPAKWRPMVTALKLPKHLNNTSLEELISSLRSHEIKLQGDEPQKNGKYVALRPKSENTKACQAEEDSGEKDSSKDEVSMISIRLAQLWKHRKRKFQASRRTKDRSGSSGKRKTSKQEVICYECNEPGHYRNDCPKLRKENMPKKMLKAKKGLMETWDDSDSEEEDSDEEQDKVALIAEASTDEVLSKNVLTIGNESDSDIQKEGLLETYDKRKAYVPTFGT